ncbi:FabD/lysophospholipase-like protein [Sporormia fimetaria CBS 119925]|uniref:FabD/lysophospholipase-like protein n=1 Tax=Sporormia fimetaria CBS 119925 TaxID=1340428 RepID=A0A6A6V5F8_9PLEO|nr:FabD/lysophospholipase-like protein [Sporormia fimetaria CBS 119925]
MRIDPSSIRYSHVEGTHYFFDPVVCPTTIQFVLSGEWKPHDVRFVLENTHDPDLRRVAEDAIANLTNSRDRRASTVRRRSPTATTGSTSPTATTYSRDDRTPRLSPTLSTSTRTPVPRRRSRSRTRETRSTYSSGRRTASPGTSSSRYTSPSATASSVVSRSPRLSPRLPYTSPYGYPPGGPPAPHHPHGVPAPVYVVPAPHPPIQAPPVVSHATRGHAKILLSMDGDGIRGLSTALIVESLVDAVCRQMDRHVEPYEIFDIIGGVSTSGLLAVMIGRLRMRTHEARDAYIEISKLVFREKWSFYAAHDFVHAVPPADDHALENAVQDLVLARSYTFDETFLDVRHGATNVFIISTSVDLGHNQPAIIRSYPSRRNAGAEYDPNITTSQAIFSTLKTPKYTAGAERGRYLAPGLVDLGTSKNNPIRDMYFETRKLYSYGHDAVILISIGTGTGTHLPNELRDMCDAVKQRVADAEKTREKFEKDQTVMLESGWMKYFRFNVDGLDGVPLEEARAVEDIKGRTMAYLARPEVYARFWEAVELICGVLRGDPVWQVQGEEEGGSQAGG